MGKVVEVLSHATVDSVVIELSDGRRAEQPLAEPWLVAVDVAKGQIELANTEAFIF